MNTQSGFTLLELLVAISIITLLASVVLSAVQDAQISSQYARAKTEMKELGRTMIEAQGEMASPISAVTQKNCTHCSCSNGTSLKQSGNSCYTSWNDTLERIIDASNGLGEGLENLDRDPWGSPYLLDENEGVSDSNPCRPDLLSTAGFDGIKGTADDFIIEIPFYLEICK